MARRVKHKLLDKFLGRILDRFKAGEIKRPSAIGAIAHLVAALDLPKGEGDDPNKYMEAMLTKDEEDD